MAPELLTINPIRNKVLNPKSIENIAYGFLDIDFIFTVNNKTTKTINRINVSKEAR